MRLSLIGLPGCGKTSVFNAVTGQNASVGVTPGKLEVHTAVTPVPDPKVDALAALYRPRKTVYATVTFVDVDAPAADGPSGAFLTGQVRNELATGDGLVHVVRAFSSEAVTPARGAVDPAGDARYLEGELILLDHVTVEGRLDRLKADWGKTTGDARRANETETELMSRLLAHLESERALRELTDLSPDERKMIRGYGLMSLKPEITVVNTDDDGEHSFDLGGAPALAMCAPIEAEIAQLPAGEREAFLEEYGIASPVSDRVIQAAYERLGVLSFYTVGDDEVRAWPIPAGATAVEAAGAIHTDLARGFIRAETTAFDDLMALGDMKAVKAAGKQRLEGKAYVVRPGDILTIRSGV